MDRLLWELLDLEEMLMLVVQCLGPAEDLQLRCASRDAFHRLSYSMLTRASVAWNIPVTCAGTIRLSEIVRTADQLSGWTAASVLQCAAGEVLEPNDHGQTALMWAAGRGHVPLCALLVEAGATLEAVDSGHWNALFRASWNGQACAVSYLLRAGANPDAKPGKYTSLMAAARFGHSEVVKELLKVGADESVVTVFGETAASLAREMRHYDCVQLLGGDKERRVEDRPVRPPITRHSVGASGRIRANAEFEAAICSSVEVAN